MRTGHHGGRAATTGASAATGAAITTTAAAITGAELLSGAAQEMEMVKAVGDLLVCPWRERAPSRENPLPLERTLLLRENPPLERTPRLTALRELEYLTWNLPRAERDERSEKTKNVAITPSALFEPAAYFLKPTSGSENSWCAWFLISPCPSPVRSLIIEQ